MALNVLPQQASEAAKSRPAQAAPLGTQAQRRLSWLDQWQRLAKRTSPSFPLHGSDRRLEPDPQAAQAAMAVQDELSMLFEQVRALRDQLAAHLLSHKACNDHTRVRATNRTIKGLGLCVQDVIYSLAIDNPAQDWQPMEPRRQLQAPHTHRLRPQTHSNGDFNSPVCVSVPRKKGRSKFTAS